MLKISFALVNLDGHIRFHKLFPFILFNGKNLDNA